MDTKQIFLPAIIILLLAVFFIPFLVSAAAPPIVSCNGPSGAPVSGTGPSGTCNLDAVNTMLVNVYNYLVALGVPLATVAITVGGILMAASAGNANMMSIGKKVLISAIIGLVLVFLAVLIINTVITATGFTGSLP
jgi:hypothetical protein